ncbi:UvrD-helicase domain-containing protein [Thermopetrobacter sp. TC1]|uniref:UvrD-helicase domain-containing protein n=1 Tax=Thermopetrobacter sp. TC1 TaxID=1495045 RepID=UPI0009DF0D5F|nr:UvrD-helicase domain-containing protein [Thermopetrobacter sp. TC1]
MADPFDLDDFENLPDPSGTGDASGAGAEAAGGGASLAAQALVAAGAGQAEPAYLAGLNPEQREAVLTTEGPVLVLAGAGTGKTRALTTRLAHILASQRAWPGQILAVTFTNKAAREMKERIRALIGDIVEGMAWLGTFHAIGMRFLQRHAEAAGLKSGFSVLDPDDQVRLLKQVLQLLDIDEKRHPARAAAALIDSWKNRGLAPEDISGEEAGPFANGAGAKVYALYQERLRAINAVDFGDLLLLPLRLLKADADLLAEYRRRFRYILVDEYQDTNTVQYLLLRLLAGENGNICCVGDDDQSIYGWRGAEVSNILRFPKDFPQAKVIRLVRNYRSTAHILGAANRLIAHNRARLGKELTAVAGTGEKVRLRAHRDDAEEARAISDDIEAFLAQGHAAGEIAVLVRASFQMRALEERFIEIGLPYQVVGGPRFFERKEVRDALAYLKVIHGPDHDLAFERIINVPKRGIGAASLRKIHDRARDRKVSLYHAAEMLVAEGGLSPKIRKSLEDLLLSLARWRAQAQDMAPAELLGVVLEESGYVDMLKAEKSVQAEGRLENLKELQRAMEDFDTLGGFLEHVALVMEADQLAGAEKVTLMTMHAAKGLEFDTVFLPGWEEGLFPHQRALDESGAAGLEEERRLAYVALTRAKRRAVISFARMRQVHGTWQPAHPSRFIDELPAEHVTVEAAGDPLFARQRTGRQGAGGFADGGADDGPVMDVPWTVDAPAADGAAAGEKEKRQNPMTRKRFAQEVTPDLRIHAGPSYQAGDRVRHARFGPGTVVAAEGMKLTIDFDEAGRKRIMASFVERA